MLTDAGYVRGRINRVAGGDFVLTAPDGRVVWERDFDAEIERLTAPRAGTEGSE